MDTSAGMVGMKMGYKWRTNNAFYSIRQCISPITGQFVYVFKIQFHCCCSLSPVNSTLLSVKMVDLLRLLVGEALHTTTRSRIDGRCSAISNKSRVSLCEEEWHGTRISSLLHAKFSILQHPGKYTRYRTSRIR